MNRDFNKTDEGFTYPYARPSLTADVVLFGIDGNDLKILLVKRNDKKEAYYDHWALPGGYYDMRAETDLDKSLEETAKRELWEETGIKFSYLEQLETFSEYGRDPRGVVVTTAYIGMTKTLDLGQKPDGVEVAEVDWKSVQDLNDLKLAFDHKEIIEKGIKRLREKSGYSTILFSFLDEEFTIPDIQSVYQTVKDKVYDSGNFRKQMLARENKEDEQPILEDTGKTQPTGRRASKVYKLTCPLDTIFQDVIF